MMGPSHRLSLPLFCLVFVWAMRSTRTLVVNFSVLFILHVFLSVVSVVTLVLK